MECYLIRHGETPGNRQGRYIGRTDEPLCEEAAAKLRSRVYPSAQMVFVSPLLRCRQTAQIIYPGCAVRVVEELAECDFGDFENKNWKELTDRPDYQAWIDSGGTLPFPSGEDPADFRGRCCRGFEKALIWCLENRIDRPAFVVHAGTIMSILERYAIPSRTYYDWHVENGGGYRFWPRIFPENAGGDERHADITGRCVRLFAGSDAR